MVKKDYEQAQIEVIVFAKKDAIVASGGEFIPEYSSEDNELEIL